MNDVLYIIGNGFDLHHGIPSSYWDFGEFLEERDSETLNFIKRYFHVNADFWSEFEQALASVDTDRLIEDASQFLVGYGADDWSDAYHHDYEYEFHRAVRAISETMRSRFGDWIRQLPMPILSGDMRVPLDPASIFLNFNYTPSLQHLYGVPNSHVLHIHGAASRANEELVLGHNWKLDPNPDPYRFEQDPEGADMRVVGGQQIVDNYFSSTFKPTEKNIRDNDLFFAGLAKVKKILVMGHSLAEVDHPYFHEVIRRIDPMQVRWKISYFGSSHDVRHQFGKLGLDPAAADFLLLTDF